MVGVVGEKVEGKESYAEVVGTSDCDGVKDVGVLLVIGGGVGVRRGEDARAELVDRNNVEGG